MSKLRRVGHFLLGMILILPAAMWITFTNFGEAFAEEITKWWRSHFTTNSEEEKK